MTQSALKLLACADQNPNARVQSSLIVMVSVVLTARYKGRNSLMSISYWTEYVIYQREDRIGHGFVPVVRFMLQRVTIAIINLNLNLMMKPEAGGALRTPVLDLGSVACASSRARAGIPELWPTDNILVFPHQPCIKVFRVPRWVSSGQSCEQSFISQIYACDRRFNQIDHGSMGKSGVPKLFFRKFALLVQVRQRYECVQ